MEQHHTDLFETENIPNKEDREKLSEYSERYERKKKNKILIRKRYLYYKHLLNYPVDIDWKRRRSAILDHIKGCLIGFIDGFQSGLMLGVQWGGAGGFIFGGMSQLWVGLLTVPIASLHGGILGFITGEKEIKKIIKEYTDCAIDSVPTNLQGLKSAAYELQ